MAYTTINKSTDYFRVKTYTGNSQDNTAITWDESTNMKPDFLWLKNRTAAQEHWLCDVVRGAGYFLESDTTNAQQDGTSGFDSFDTNGFTVDNTARTNRNTMVGWGWLAGGTGSANTDGTVNTTVSANTTAGFSIVTYTGDGNNNATFGHGLGAIPKVVLVKKLAGTVNWYMRHESLSSGYNIMLNLTEAPVNASTYNAGMIKDLDNANTFSIAKSGSTNPTNNNGTGEDYVAYCFAEKTGYSKFGSYTSNNTANDGPFIYTGFKPAFVLTKISSGGGTNWRIFDNKRDGFNGANQQLQPNSSGVESNDSPSQMDLLSNGFKLRGAEGDSNYNTETVIYMAFAEAPLVGSNGVTAKAR